MAPRQKSSTTLGTQTPLEQYEHPDKTRKNNPPVGLVTADTEKENGKKTYAYDPHLDPRLEWSGKKEHTSFDVPTVPLHVHERIDPKTIIEAVRTKKYEIPDQPQLPLFETVRENPPLREALDFYKHSHNWSNRLIAGDSLLVMNSLIEKEGMAGQVQMIYIDPPYGIKYGSNFQPFVNKRDVKDGKDDDLTAEPEQIRAFRDTWELGIHSYLTYLRDRLLLARELLNESGSIFVQIGIENLHHVREVLDEVFKPANHLNTISFLTTSGFETLTLSRAGDYLLWYAKDATKTKYRELYEPQEVGAGLGGYNWILLKNGTQRSLTADERSGDKPIPAGAQIYKVGNIKSQGASSSSQQFKFDGKIYESGPNHHWKTSVEGLKQLAAQNRIHVASDSIQYRRFPEDFPYKKRMNIWTDTRTGNFLEEKQYVVQTSPKVVARCLLMTTDPGDLVIDPTCGSGTTAFVAEQWGRRWITCDTSRVAITLAKQRLMTALYDYYELSHPQEGVGSGFKYRTVPHVTLKSIANNEPPAQETLYDQPLMDKHRGRITGPFTVEAVPAPVVKPLSDIKQEPITADGSVSRAGTTSRQAEWRGELLKTGIRGKGKQMIEFSRIEPLPGTRWLHADGETKGAGPERAVISFGPEYAPLEQKQVELAWEEARKLSPKPSIIVFASFHFDPEAAKDIDELTRDKTGMTFLKVQMNTDLLTEDLKKQRSSNQSFWLMGQPDVEVREIKKGTDKGRYQVEVHGFDYYNTKTGSIESGDTSKIAVWMLDTDYDSRSLYPRQVFFPMAGEKDGWSRLAKNLKAEIDEELIEAYRGTVSLPFELGNHKRVAVKIVDDRGIESLKVIEVA
ncbi:MAG: site-specific DNA-methyltransferase [Elusimicrobiota bacterium]